MKRPYLLFRRGKIYYYKLAGNKTYQSTGKTKEAEAHNYVLEILGKLPVREPKRTPKLKDYAVSAFDRYVLDKATAGSPLGESYVKLSRGYIERFVLTDPIAEQRIGEIRPGDFEDFQTRLLRRIPNKRTTAKRSLEVLRLILRRAYRRGEIDRNPADGVLQFAVTAKQRGIYELAELEKLFPKDVWQKGDFSPWQDAYDYTAFLLAATTGMRKSEVLALRWPAVDLDRGIVEVRTALKGSTEGLPKSGKTRATPIFDMLYWQDRRTVEALRNLKRLQASRRMTAIDRPVFAYVDGSLRGGTWWAKHLRSALTKAGINRFRGEGRMPLDAHSLRHTIASHLKGKGVSSDLIREFCGWSCARMQATYSHVEPEVLSTVMDKIRLSL